MEQFLTLPYMYIHMHTYQCLYARVHICVALGKSLGLPPLLVSKWRGNITALNILYNCVTTCRQEKAQHFHLHPITANSKKLQQGHTTERCHQPKGAISGTSSKELLADIPRYFLLCPFILPYALHIPWPPSQRGRLGVTPLVKRVCSMP